MEWTEENWKDIHQLVGGDMSAQELVDEVEREG